MRPFRQTGRDELTSPWQLKIPTVAGKQWPKRSLETSDYVKTREGIKPGAIPNAMADMIETLADKLAWDILERISAKKPSLTVKQLWAWWDKTPGRRNARSGDMMAPGDDERIQHVRDTLSAVDLDQVLTDWETRGAKGRYVSQVRKFIPKGKMFTLPEFTRPRVIAHLDKIPGLNTRIHHRAAFQQFGHYLADVRHLYDANPCAAITFEEKFSPKYPLFLEPEQAPTLVHSLPDGDLKAMVALMFGSGIEWQVAGQLYRRDFKPLQLGTRVFLANGTKNHGGKTWRRRWAVCTEDWCWEIVERYLNTLAPAAPLFPQSWKAYGAPYKAAAKALGLPVTTFHSCRHTFIAMWIDRIFGGQATAKRNEKWLKRQVGHSPRSTLIHTTYGVRIEEAESMAQEMAPDVRVEQAPNLTMMT